jgi:hypothetical protein
MRGIYAYAWGLCETYNDKKAQISDLITKRQVVIVTTTWEVGGRGWRYGDGRGSGRGLGSVGGRAGYGDD